MKKNYFKSIVWRAVNLSFLIFLINLFPADAQQTVIVQTPPIQQQQTQVWCWAASIQNVLAAYGVTKTQQEIVAATYGTVIMYPLFNSKQAVFNLLNANYQVSPQGMVVHPFYIDGAPRADILIRELGRERSPLLVFYNNQQGGGHVVVCYGARYTGNESSPTITEIFVKDPWDATEKTWSGAQLASLWQSTIFLRVAPRPSILFSYGNESFGISPTFNIVSQYTNMIEGRVWFFNADRQWHIINNQGRDLGPVPID